MAVSVPVSDWWCCMSDAKRGALVGIFDLWVEHNDITPRAVVDLILLANGFPAGRADYELFIATFGLTIVGIEVEGVEIEAVLFDDLFYTSLLDYQAETGFDCPDPCYVLKFALSHI